MCATFKPGDMAQKIVIKLQITAGFFFLKKNLISILKSKKKINLI